ncbi:MAG: hypothetical protein IJH63_08085 [Methanobrevibacter sp.]|nr:hypothetical protein [Methanobrevibacter sp.]MBR0370660.1 hypothetical protein [Methanobrevibacter sp.]
MYEEPNLEEIIAHHGFDPYIAIEKHINEEIIPKFDCLISCHRSNHDEEGNPAIEFYIRYNRKLDLETERKLFRIITNDLFDFCEKSNFLDEVMDYMDLLVLIDGEYYM